MSQSNGEPEGVRLQKVMAAAGVASRRVCEDLIVQGKVKVNGAHVVLADVATSNGVIHVIDGVLLPA